MFFTRFHVSTTATTVIFAVFYFVSYAGFNCMWIAYRALLGIIGRTSQQTVALTISGTQLSTVASLFYSYLGVKMLTAFPSAETGYTVSALVYGAIMVGSMVLVFFIARPYDVEQQPQQEEGDKPAPQEKVTVRDMLRALPPILPFAISYILSIGASTLLFSCLVYYFNYSVGDPAKMSVLLTEMTIVRFAATFVVRWLSGKLDKKYIYMCGVGLAAICSLLAYFLRANMLLFFICMGAYFFVLVPAGAMFMPCVADATDYNEYKRGIRARSFTYSVASTLMYIAQVVGASCASYGLVKIGYDASLAAQPASVTHGIAVVTLLGTALLTALSILPMFFYKLDRHTMQPIYDLKEAPAAEGERADS